MIESCFLIHSTFRASVHQKSADRSLDRLLSYPAANVVNVSNFSNLIHTPHLVLIGFGVCPGYDLPTFGGRMPLHVLKLIVGSCSTIVRSLKSVDGLSFFRARRYVRVCAFCKEKSADSCMSLNTKQGSGSVQVCTDCGLGGTRP